MILAVKILYLLILPIAIVQGIHLQNRFGVPDSLRVLSALKHILRYDTERSHLLNELYAFVMGLDSLELIDNAFSVGLEIDEMPIDQAIASLLDKVYHKPHYSDVFQFYYNLYPMGIYPDSTELPQLNGSRNYFMLNGEQYDKPDDVFYLKSKELSKQAAVPDSEVITDPTELIIGTNPKSPLIVLYGCPIDDQFEEFHRNLYAEAAQDTGKFRFIWRSTCSPNMTSPMANNFGLSLSIRERSELELILKNPEFHIDVPEDFTESEGTLDIVRKKDLEVLDLKVTSLIANHYYNTKNISDTLHYAKSIINNFPLYVSQLIDMDLHPKEQDKILAYNNDLKKKGVDYNLLGLFINGQQLKVSSLNEYVLLNAIDKEYNLLQHLSNSLTKIDGAASIRDTKQLLNEFSTISLPHLQASQPVKIDLHRIPGFSDTVIYFNDITIDEQYKELSNDVSVFFEKSPFGELPAYKQNWNEVIFAIDFNDLDNPNTKFALAGLNRALTVVAQGYPQRIGLLPFNSEHNFNANLINVQDDEGEVAKIINKIYDLKRYDMEELMKFLEKLQEKGNNLNFKEPTLNSIMKMPNYAKQVRDLQIYETSLIVNGEIYPFRPNTFNYLISNVIKKDADFIRQQLNSKASRNGKPSSGSVDVRGMLHLKSACSRHLKYMPEYYADALYSSENLEILEQIDPQRILTFTFDHNLNVLHTITLVDDFECKDTLRRLRNILKTKFKGIRIRLIHTGDIKSRNWKDLFNLQHKEDAMKMLKKMWVSKPNKKHSRINEIDNNVLKNWLPQIPMLYLKTQSFFVLNGRFIHFEEDELTTTREFSDLIQREAIRTLDSISSLEKVFSSFSDSPISADSIETVSSILTKMYYHSTQLNDHGIEYTTETVLPRIDLSQILKENDFTIFGSNYNNEKVIDIVLLLDPLEERTQKLISLVSKFEKFYSVSIKIALFPTEKLTIVPIERIYIDDTIKAEAIDDKLSKSFDVSVDSPQFISISETNTIDDIMLEVYVFDEHDSISQGRVDGVSSLPLELVDSNGHIVDSTFTMKTFGYAQFHVPNLGTNFTVRIVGANRNYEIVSISSYGFSDFIENPRVDILDLNPAKLYVRVRKTGDNEVINISADNNVNIFTVLKDSTDEDRYKDMVLNILAKVDKVQGTRTLIFWILDSPFLSKSFKDFITNFNENNELLGAHINMLKYNWPNWLRPQRFRYRKMQVSKLLFIDVLFPSSIEQVIYMSPLGEPFDPIALLDENSSKKTSFSLFKMTGHGYWEEGYWEKMLRDHGLSFYSISPGFLINLKRIRELNTGDKLRLHYQRLSTDINSLINIDQDLINNLQMEVPVGTLKPIYSTPIQKDDSYLSKWLPILGRSRLTDTDERSDNFAGRPSDISKDAENDLFEHDEL